MGEEGEGISQTDSLMMMMITICPLLSPCRYVCMSLARWMIYFFSRRRRERGSNVTAREGGREGGEEMDARNIQNVKEREERDGIFPQRALVMAGNKAAPGVESTLSTTPNSFQ